ncbi:MAG TPA: LytTR family DNA-binding domain-containing protein [Chitinophagaceae bacterium]|jgi:Response regulator of the LytR/AlgR family
MNCIIVDDNKMARMAMAHLVAQVQYLTLLGECEDAMEGYNMVNQQRVDLLLLDIEMPGLSGLELTKNLGDKKPLIIFTTAKKDYAVEAFELNVVDYLIKPVTPARFIKAIERAREIMNSQPLEIRRDEKEFVFIRDNGILKRINLADILYLEAMGDYVKLHTTQRFHVIHTTLKAVEEKLPAAKFMRIHRSYIVSITKIDFIEEGTLNIGHHLVPVADAYRMSLQKRLNLL